MASFQRAADVSQEHTHGAIVHTITSIGAQISDGNHLHSPQKFADNFKKRSASWGTYCGDLGQDHVRELCF